LVGKGYIWDQFHVYTDNYNNLKRHTGFQSPLDCSCWVPWHSAVTGSSLLTCSLSYQKFGSSLLSDNLATRSWFSSLYYTIVIHRGNDDWISISASVVGGGGTCVFFWLVNEWLWNIPAVPMLQGLWILGIMSHYISEALTSDLVRVLDVPTDAYCNFSYFRWKPK
jgi:hypothetical protein